MLLNDLAGLLSSCGTRAPQRSGFFSEQWLQGVRASVVVVQGA